MRHSSHLPTKACLSIEPVKETEVAVKNIDLQSEIYRSNNKKPRLLANHEIPAQTTKGELAKEYGIEFSFDFAIPNDWACIAQEVSGMGGGWWNVIWAYDEKSGGWGRPFPLTLEALRVIQKTNEKLGWVVPEENDFDFFFIPPQN